MATRGRAPCEAGTRSVSRACWASSTRASNMRAPWSRGSVSTSQPGVSGSTAGVGLGEGEQGGAEHGAVLDAAATLDPDSAGTVLGDREEAAGVRGSLLPGEGGLVAALGAVGVDDLGEVAGGAGQLGGVEPPGLLQQHLLASGPQSRARGQGVHASQMIPAWAAETSRRDAGPRGCADCSATSCWACTTARRPVAAGQAGEVGEPVGRGAPVQLLAGQVAGVGLGQQLRLERRQLSLQLLDRGQPLDQVVVGEPGDEPVVEHPHLDAGGSSTTAGEAPESTAGSGSRHRCPGTHPPGLGMTSMPARHRMTSPGSTDRRTTASLRPEGRVLHPFEHTFECIVKPRCSTWQVRLGNVER